MSVMALGLNHTTAPVDLRGRFAFPGDRLVPALQAFRGRVRGASEVAIVSTCNRTEIYVGSENKGAAAGDHDARTLAAETLGWLSKTGGVSQCDLDRHIYVLEDSYVARHAFRLASGLSSMVVGETQILGQLKQAVREADGAGTLGTTLHQLFQRSFAVAKEVRTDTDIGRHTVSMAAAVVQLAERLFDDFSALNVLMIGAGQMAPPVLDHLAARSPKRITVANRSIERGREVASRYGADALGLDEAMQRLGEFDVVVACTASPLPVLSAEAARRAVRRRRRRPMLMVDLAVPRDIEPEVATLEDVYLYSVDDLEKILKAGADKRVAAVDKAETIIESGVRSFVRWLGVRESVPIIQALQTQAETWRMAEVQRARKLLARGDDLESVLEALSRGITQKMLHGPVAGLHHGDSAERLALSETLSRLYLRCPARGGHDA